MKKILSLTLLLCLALSSTAFGGWFNKKKKKTDKPIVLRLADVHNEGYPTIMADKEFARLVKERTNGKIIIEVYPGGQLGDEKSVIEQVQFGAIDITRTNISPLTEFQKKLSVLMLPYIYRDKDHMFKVLDGSIGDKFLSDLKSVNLVGLSWYDSGARSFYNSKREIKNLDDLKGLKIRVQESEIMLDLVKAVGASPTPMAFGEVYSAIQTGVIDGAENNWASYLSTSHYEVAKFYTIDEHTRAPEMLMISKMTYEKLTGEQQNIIKQAAEEAAVYEREQWAKNEKKAEDKIVANGNVITRLNAPTKKQFQDSVSALYTKYGKEYQDLIEDVINTK